MKLLRILLILLSVWIPPICMAEVNNDRQMAKIVRDGQTYISADVREASEEAAQSQATDQLLVSVKDYLRDNASLGITPESFTLSSLSKISHQLTSKISDSRYRVVMYVEKSQLNPSRKSESVSVLSQTGNTGRSKEIKVEVYSDGQSSSESSPVVRMISQLTTRQEVVQKLKDLHTKQVISGGASFPLASANDFYVVVMDGDRVLTTLHYLNGTYIDGDNSKEVDINKFARYSGYWFTIPNTSR